MGTALLTQGYIKIITPSDLPQIDKSETSTFLPIRLNEVIIWPSPKPQGLIKCT
jgi:hypothetical protein